MRRIKILEEISSDKGYSDAILTTFKFNRFFETEVLQALRDSGVENVILLIDETEYHQKYSKAKEQGIKYYFEPIRLNGTFHPKILFLIGGEKAKLIVTSANLTDTAYTRNAELAISIGLTSSKEIQKLFSDTGEFFINLAEGFVRSGKSTEVIKDILSNPPWEEPETEPENPGIRFIHNLSTPIMEQINFEEKYSLIQILSPYYDMNLSALESISELGDEIELYLQNKATNLPKRKMKKIFGDSVPIYDLTFPKENQILHGKAILFHNSYRQILFGSANLSKPALEKTPPEGNIETCLSLREETDKQLELLENKYVEIREISLQDLETQEENPDEAKEEIKHFLLRDVLFKKNEKLLECEFDFPIPNDAKLKVVVEDMDGNILKEDYVKEEETGIVKVEMAEFELRDLIGTDVTIKVYEGKEELIAESLPRRPWNPYQKMLGDAERSLKSVWKKEGEDFLEQAIRFGEKNPTDELEFIHLFYTYAMENLEDLTQKNTSEEDNGPLVGRQIGEEIDPELHSPFQPGELDTYNLREWKPEGFKTIEKVLSEVENKFEEIKKPDITFLSEESFLQFFNFLKIVAKEIFLRQEKKQMIEETNPIAKLKESIVKRFIEDVLPAARNQFNEKKVDYLLQRAGVCEHLMIWWYLTDYYLEKKYDPSLYENVLSAYIETYKFGVRDTNDFDSEKLSEALKDYREVKPINQKDVIHSKKELEMKQDK